MPYAWNVAQLGRYCAIFAIFARPLRFKLYSSCKPALIGPGVTPNQVLCRHRSYPTWWPAGSLAQSGQRQPRRHNRQCRTMQKGRSLIALFAFCWVLIYRRAFAQESRVNFDWLQHYALRIGMHQYFGLRVFGADGVLDLLAELMHLRQRHLIGQLQMQLHKPADA